jgi:hypothetical protein
MPASEVKKVVAQVNQAGSQAEALDIVSAAREERVEQLRSVASGFKPRERRSTGSAQHIGGLVKFEVDDLLDVAPEKQYETFGRLKILRDRLDIVVQRAQQEWELTPPPAEEPSSGVDRADPGSMNDFATDDRDPAQAAYAAPVAVSP